jgi:hypothetical protein
MTIFFPTINRGTASSSGKNDGEYQASQEFTRESYEMFESELLKMTRKVWSAFYRYYPNLAKLSKLLQNLFSKA